MRLGIFGGTFNPIHNGHIRISKYFKEKLNLDKILLIPTNIPPHKKADLLANSVDRLNMCKLASKSYDFIEVSDVELKREGVSRTADTIDQLKLTYPDAELFLIVGSDMFLSFDRWYRYEYILQNVTICCAARSQKEINSIKIKEKYFLEKNARVFVGEIEPFEISSTEIREKIIQDQVAHEYLPNYVEKYCRALNIYKNIYFNHDDISQENCSVYHKEYNLDIEKYWKCVKKTVNPKRAYHSFCVSREAVRLSVIYGADPQKAQIAGLLHDILKDTKGDKLLQLISDSDIILDSMIKVFPGVWHGFAGAEYIYNKFNITDQDILCAVRYHTTARKNMSLLEKIIYLADLSSYDRNYHDVEILRKKLEISIDGAMKYALSFSIETLIKKGLPILQGTYEAYNQLFFDNNI